MGAIITLTTDFGLADAYVAAMKGVILSINPRATIVDICHQIRPQNIAQAAFILSTSYQFFPKRTIHVVVVDPGVGTKRRAIILRTPLADFVAPDNGVLSYVIQQSATKPTGINHPKTRVPKEMTAIAITKPEFWHTPVSTTFHGRDIFAPVAAHLSLGRPPGVFGEPLDSLTILPLPLPQRVGRILVGQVLHTDTFGNLITNIRENDLSGGEITLKIKDKLISGLSRTYTEGEGLIALIGSSGYLEISVREGNASVLLGAGVGDPVRVKLNDKKFYQF